MLDIIFEPLETVQARATNNNKLPQDWMKQNIQTIQYIQNILGTVTQSHSLNIHPRTHNSKIFAPLRNFVKIAPNDHGNILCTHLPTFVAQFSCSSSSSDEAGAAGATLADLPKPSPFLRFPSHPFFWCRSPSEDDLSARCVWGIQVLMLSHSTICVFACLRCNGMW